MYPEKIIILIQEMKRAGMTPKSGDEVNTIFVNNNLDVVYAECKARGDLDSYRFYCSKIVKHGTDVAIYFERFLINDIRDRVGKTTKDIKTLTKMHSISYDAMHTIMNTNEPVGLQNLIKLVNDLGYTLEMVPISEHGKRVEFDIAKHFQLELTSEDLYTKAYRYLDMPNRTEETDLVIVKESDKVNYSAHGVLRPLTRNYDNIKAGSMVISINMKLSKELVTTLHEENINTDGNVITVNGKDVNLHYFHRLDAVNGFVNVPFILIVSDINKPCEITVKVSGIVHKVNLWLNGVEILKAGE